MKIIGAGLPRTATLTQKISLEQLGFGPCYHMVNILSDMSLVQRWQDAFDSGADWEKMFDGFESTVAPAGFVPAATAVLGTTPLSTSVWVIV